MSLSKDMEKAYAARDKLVRYCNGLPKGCPENPKYLELNRKASEAIDKLPEGIMRTRLAEDIAAAIRSAKKKFSR